MTTKRLGTSFADQRIVTGNCERQGCTGEDAILYSHHSDDGLFCADCQRQRVREHPTPQACDNCGATGNVWRDPVHRRNEYLCINCHDPEHLFQNRWANAARANEGFVLGLREKPECALKDRGTDCKGEVKWRSAMALQVCNKHAGKPGVGPNG